MFKSTKEFDRAILKLLTALRDNEDLWALLTDDDSKEALVECIDRGLIQGVKYGRTQDGQPHFDKIKPRVSYSGLAFIESKN